MAKKNTIRTIVGVACSALAGASYGIDTAVVTKEDATLVPTDYKEYLLKWGKVNFKPSAAVSAFYDDNFRNSGIDKQSDFIWNISPGITASLGEDTKPHQIKLSYIPRIELFTEHSEENTVDHEASLLARWNFSRLRLSLQQDFSSPSDPEVDAGDRVSRRIYRTAVTAVYDYSQKTDFGVSLQQLIGDYEDLNSYNTWEANGFMDYKVTPKLVLGAGGAYRFRDAQNQPNMNAEQAFMRAGYRVTSKISLNASAGVEFRQYQGGFNDDPSPIFGLGVVYRPWQSTSISIDGSRTEQSSVVLGGQSYLNTGVMGQVAQRFYRKYYVSLLGGVSRLDYQDVVAGVTAPDREDDYWFAGVGVDTTFYKRWLVGAYYRYSENSSNIPRFSFTSNQVGVRTSYQF